MNTSPLEDQRLIAVSLLEHVSTAAVAASGIRQRATILALRQSSAVHLLEAGVNLCVIQIYLGHHSPIGTAIHPHLNRSSEDRARAAHGRVASQPTQRLSIRTMALVLAENARRRIRGPLSPAASPARAARH